MKKLVLRWLFLVCLFFIITAGTTYSQAIEGAAAVNNIPERGGPWRIGYVESEPFLNYAGTFYYLLQGLEKLGWLTNIKGIPYEIGQEDTIAMWRWLGEHDLGSYLEFPAAAHFCLSNPDVSIEEVYKAVDAGEVDLLIAMGTKAGTEITRRRPGVPVLVFSTSNAVQAGIVRSTHDSGSDNIWAHMDSNRYRRQIEVFHDIFNFRKLGMVYDDSPIGRLYAAINDVQDMAQQKGFTVYDKHVDEWNVNDPKDRERYYQDMKVAYGELAQEVDAMYVTVADLETERLAELFQAFYEKKIPIFSQQGSEEVKHGALLSLYRADFSGVGYFGAGVIIKALEGEDLRFVPQVYGDTPSIVINLKVAELIDYQVPFEILLVADEIFLDIGNEKQEGAMGDD